MVEKRVNFSTMPFAIIDNGCGTIKAGMNDGKLSSVFLNRIGRDKYTSCFSPEMSHCMIGYEPNYPKRGITVITYPIKEGRIVNWADIERVWRHAMCSEIRREPEKCGLLMTEHPCNPKQDREKMTEIIFELLCFPIFYLANRQVMALYGSGKINGVVVSCGDKMTFSVPIADGIYIPSAVQRMCIAGENISCFCINSLGLQGRGWSLPEDVGSINDLKESVLFLMPDFASVVDPKPEYIYKNKPYILPDGNELAIGEACFRSPEILFSPSLCERKEPGIHEIVYKSIQSSDADIRCNLWPNIVLAGGSTMIRGFRKRLEMEIRKRAPFGSNVFVTAPQERKHLAWFGADLFTQLSSFRKMCISKEDYDEVGPSIIHRKC